MRTRLLSNCTCCYVLKGSIGRIVKVNADAALARGTYVRGVCGSYLTDNICLCTVVPKLDWFRSCCTWCCLPQLQSSSRIAFAAPHKARNRSTLSTSMNIDSNVSGEIFWILPFAATTLSSCWLRYWLTGLNWISFQPAPDCNLEQQAVSTFPVLALLCTWSSVCE